MEKLINSHTNKKESKRIMNAAKKFVTAINCMDGRVQLPVIEFLREEYDATYVDVITEAGPNKILSEYQDRKVINSIKTRVEVSTEKHNSKLIAIVGHYDCGGNPAEKDEQIVQINKSIENVVMWNDKVKVVGLWVDKDWKVNKL